MTGREEYAAFLAGKGPRVSMTGFDVPAPTLPAGLFDWQQQIVRWALRRGRAALFCDTGMGKTALQLSWAQQVHMQTGGDVLVLAPLAVTAQTVREAAKFGIGPVRVCRSGEEVQPGITVANYEMLHHFDPTRFIGMVADESSILKNYMGVTKRHLTEAFAQTPYRLCCTATPAPNDHMEIGNHAEFLGIMPANEMLSRWFINDTTQMGTYRLKGHAVGPFWEWVASWAVSCRRPSDLGYSDDGFVLPPLHMEQVTVDVDLREGADGTLFRMPLLNATGVHREMRLTAESRAQAVAEAVNASADAWVVWCSTNYEADELVARIPDALEVRGSESPEAKEQKILDFIEGRARVVISKPTIFGFGLNLQHCHNVAFVGLSYSMEQFYQAIRRCYRFGQQFPVRVVVVAAATEGAILTTVQRKLQLHEQMMDGMVAAASRLSLRADLQLDRYVPHAPMIVPAWLHSRAS